MKATRFTVEVAFGVPSRQLLRSVSVAPGTTVGEAIELSGILQDCPEISLDDLSVGVFGRRCGIDTCVRAGDRVEIYRRLVAEPKEVRRRKADRQRSGG